MEPSLVAKAERFRGLHRGPDILVLANAWDVASARILASFPGCKAIGTSSAGVAAVLGYVDGQGISREEMLDMVGRIARAVEIPVSADVEAGYGDSPVHAAETARAVIEVGAVGVNLEDGALTDPASLVETSIQAGKIRAMRRAAEEEGLPLFINARVDTYWLGIGEPGGRFDLTVSRARSYLEAGADCIFVPGVSEHAVIGALTAAIPAPLNVLAGSGVPSVEELGRLGVARVSVGSGFMRSTIRHLQRIADAYLASGTYAAFADDAVPYPELAALLRG